VTQVAPPFDPDWSPLDPMRTCYTCGGEPTGTFNDGSPSYGADHPSHGDGGVKAPDGWRFAAPPNVDDLYEEWLRR
jgi:hypothetical protein